MIALAAGLAATLWRVVGRSGPVRRALAVLSALAAAGFVLWRALRSAEQRGARARQAEIDRHTLEKIDHANRAETDANSGSARDRRLHDRFDRD